MMTIIWRYFQLLKVLPSTHHAVPLDETAPNNQVSRSRNSQIFPSKNELGILDRIKRQEILSVLYYTKAQDVSLQTDAEVCAIQALSVVS